jgi:hypothetical protein
MASTKSNAQAAGLGARECLQLVGVDVREFNKPQPDLQALPSRATLARKWPRLKINRLTWHWRDDATGANGSDFESLRAFLAWGGARR